MQLSFSNMTMKLNIFNIAKQSHDVNERIVDMNLIKELVKVNDDPLQIC